MMFEGSRKHSLRHLIYYLRYTEFTALARIINQKLIAPNVSFPRTLPEKKFCLFISGCPGDPYRYRCEHQAAQLDALGVTSDICYASQIDNHALADRYQWLWLHRVFDLEGINEIIEAAHCSGKPVVFDIDDLVFDESAIPYMRATQWMSKHEVEQVYKRARGYSKTMSRCDIISVPTDDLRRAVIKIFPKACCIVTENILSDAHCALATQAL